MIRSLVVLISVALLGSAQAAVAQPAAGANELPKRSEIAASGVILLLPDRALTVSGGFSEKPTLVTETAAGPNPLPPIKADPTKEEWIKVEGAPVVPPAGQLTFAMWVSDEGHTYVRTLNGTATPIVYIANLIRRIDGALRVYPTTICAVKAGAWGVEHWPYRIEALQITGMGQVSEDTCFDAATKSAYKVGQQPPSAAKP